MTRCEGHGEELARRRLLSMAAAIAATAFLGGCTAATHSVDISPTRSIAVDRAGALTRLNALRARNGLKPVAYDTVLDRAAERQAKAMAAKGDMDHNLDGPLPERVEFYGYQWSAIAENLGWNYPSTAAVMTGWENSPGHRRNLLNPMVDDIGFAAAVGPNGDPYWAMILGKERQKRR